MGRIVTRSWRRMRGRSITLCGVVAGAVVGACGDDGPSWPANAARAVVTVEVQRCDRPTRDSGFGVRVDDRIVTAAHTVEGDLRDLRVDGREATLVAIDARSDLAVLHVGGAVGPSITVAPAASVDAADRLWLLTRGEDGPNITPLAGLRPTALTVHDTTAQRTFVRDAIAFDGAVADGTSGAPVVTEAGEVAGIVVLAVRGRGLSYAVSAAEIDAVVGRASSRTLEPAAACA